MDDEIKAQLEEVCFQIELALEGLKGIGRTLLIDDHETIKELGKKIKKGRSHTGEHLILDLEKLDKIKN